MWGREGGGRQDGGEPRLPAPGQAPLSGQPHSQHADSNINGCRWARRAPGRVGPTVVAASARRPRAGLASGVDVAPPRALGKALRATDGSGCADRWARRAGRGPRCRLRQLEGRGKDEGAPGPSKCPFCSALLGKKNSFRGSWAEAWQSGDRSPCQLPCPCRACAGPQLPARPAGRVSGVARTRAPGDTAVHSGSLGVSPWWRAAVTPQVTCPLSRPIHRHRGGRYRCPPSPMSQMVEQPPCTLAWRPRSQVSAGPSTPSLGPAGPALCLSVLSALAALATPAASPLFDVTPTCLPTCGLLCCPPPSQPLRLLTPHLRWPQSTVPPCSSFSHEHSLSLAHHDIRLLIPSLSRGLTFVTVAGEGWKVTSCSFPLLSAGQQLHVVSLARHSWGRPARGSDVGVSVAATSASSLP